MIESQKVHIKNFRAFEDFTVTGLRKVNLIGGKNNAGKTSLLEALFLFFYPHLDSLITIKRSRKQSPDLIKKRPKEAWDNLFYNQDITEAISFKGNIDGIIKEVKILASHSLQDDFFEEEDLKELFEFISQENSSVSVLQIQQIIDTIVSSKKNIVASSRGLLSPGFSDDINVPLIPSSIPISNEEIAQNYDRVDYDGKSEQVLKLLKVLDGSIVRAQTYSFGEPTLYLWRENQKKGLPISLFGDAIYRSTALALEILSGDNKNIFIDEIENGLHYTSQQKFWNALFQLSKDLDTTIFATTHSLEMIKAFSNVSDEFADMGAYIELARHPKKGQIISITRSIKDLCYELEHHKLIRGE